MSYPTAAASTSTAVGPQLQKPDRPIPQILIKREDGVEINDEVDSISDIPRHLPLTPTPSILTVDILGDMKASFCRKHSSTMINYAPRIASQFAVRHVDNVRRKSFCALHRSCIFKWIECIFFLLVITLLVIVIKKNTVYDDDEADNDDFTQQILNVSTSAIDLSSNETVDLVAQILDPEASNLPDVEYNSTLNASKLIN
uniref:Uncharacterized protein n=1 Tax=Syphacia muris TaxID=451379 RepID=A0A0N5AV28_9BILA